MPELSSHPTSLGVCYYPEHWEESRWPADLTAMRELGIRYVRVAEFAWSRFEPEPGAVDFGWLWRFLDLAHATGLHVVVGTPSACPPKWLVDQMPDMLAMDEDGLPRAFGSRRHYCFSHEGYRGECRRIVTAMAEAVGNHPAVFAWQIDNEYGCHDTALSYSAAARGRFRDWLRHRYHGDVATLNQAWGNVFWSLEYRDFDEIELPNRTPTDPNPAHALDFRRFSSDAIREFQAVQLEVLRAGSPSRPITHNFMGGFTDFEHFEVARDLDFASWDSYPLGFLATFPMFSDAHRKEFLRTGDPDFAAFNHDLYRVCGHGRWWVMEQQPGPVNWAPYNPAPLPGMVRLWALEAFAHGAEVVSYFRWRQAPFAQEQYHTGLQLPDGQPDVASAEVARVSRELAVFDGTAPGRADVALVFDYAAEWTIAVQPQCEEFSYLAEAFRAYRAIRRAGLDVDIVPAGGDLRGYGLIVVPSLPITTPEFVAAVRGSTGVVLFGPRLGSKTEHFNIPGNLPPGPMQEFLPLQVHRVDSLPDFAPQPVTWRGTTHEARLWVEHVASGLTPLARFADDGRGALFRHERFLYLAGLPDDRWLDALVWELATEQNLPVLALLPGVRTRRRGALRCFCNLNAHPVALTLPAGLEAVVGNEALPPAGVSIFRDQTTPGAF